MRARFLVALFGMSVVLLHCGDNGAAVTSNNDGGTSPVDAGSVDAAKGSMDAGTSGGGMDAGTGVDAGKPPPGTCGAMPASCTQVQALANHILLPRSSSDYAYDVDGDGIKEDALGGLLGGLLGGGVDAQPAEDQKVQDGTIIMLLSELSLDATFTTDATGAFARVQPGQSQASPDFSGSGMFMASATAPATFPGTIVTSIFDSPSAALTPTAYPIVIPLEISAAGAAMPLYVTHVTITNTAGKPSTASLNGAYKESDVTGILVPAIATSTNEYIAANPGTATSMQLLALFDGGGCTNPGGSMAKANDGIIDPCEISSNSLVKSLLAPDVQLFDAAGNFKPVPKGTAKDAFSVGLQLSLVGAQF